MRRKMHFFTVLSLILSFTLLVACGSSGDTTTGTPSPSEGEPADTTKSEGEVESVTLRAVSAWPVDDIQSSGFAMLVEKIEANSNGKIKVEWQGGPETIPPFELGEALRNKVVDMAAISAAYYAPQMPESLALDYSMFTPQEERSNGGFELMNQIHQEKMNSFLLGRSNGFQYNFYSKTEIKSIDDFQGKTFRAAPIYVPAAQALGGSVVNMPVGDTYSALEKGVIDGIAYPEAGITVFGFEEQLKYKISPSFYQIDAVFLVNMDTWNSIPAELQQIMIDSAIEVENELPAKLAQYTAEEDAKLKEQGLEFVQLPEEEFLKIVNDAGWEWMLKNSPEYGQQLKDALQRK